MMMNFHLVFPVLLALGLPAVAQSNLDQQKLQKAAKACGKDKVCLFGVVERQFKQGMTADELANPWALYSLIIGGLQASAQAELLSEKRDILDRAIQLLDENYHDPDEPYFPSSPIHLLRAELCLKTADNACFLQSAALLLEREIASREETIESERERMSRDEAMKLERERMSREGGGINWERLRALIRAGNKDHLSPPIRWSDIRDMRYDQSRSGGPKFGWGEIALYLRKVGPGNVVTRIDEILSENERRTL